MAWPFSSSLEFESLGGGQIDWRAHPANWAFFVSASQSGQQMRLLLGIFHGVPMTKKSMIGTRAKIPSGCEINSLRDFLTAPTCYNSRPCPAGSGCGSEYLFASFICAEACSWRIWHCGNNSLY